MEGRSKLTSCIAVCLLLGAATASSAQTSLGPVNVGSSTTATATVTFSAAGSITSIAVVTGGASGQDFSYAGTGTCQTGAAYDAGASCTVDVLFKPGFAGFRSGAVVLHGSTGVLAAAFVSGIGVGPQIAFNANKVTTFDPSIHGNAGSIGLEYPSNVAIDGFGTQYVVTSNTSGIVEIPGGGGSPLIFDPVVNGSTVGEVLSVAVDAAGDLFMDDITNDRVVESRPDGSYVEFFDPYETGAILNVITVGPGGDLFMVNGVTGTVLEYPGGDSQVSPVKITLNNPVNIASMAEDRDGNLFLSNATEVIELSAADVRAGNGTGTVVAADVWGGFNPRGIAFDGAGDLYIVDDSNNRVIELLPGTTLISAPPTITITPAVTESSGPSLSGIAVAGNGDLFLADIFNNQIVQVLRTQPAEVSFAKSPLGTKSADSPQTVQVQNIGAAPLTFSEISYPADFPAATGTNSCEVSSALNASQACNLNINFIPSSASTFHESITVVDNNLNVSGAKQTVAVTGTGYYDLLSASSLAFGFQNVGATSASQQVTLTNTTGATIQISGIQVTGANASSFVFGSNCPASLVNGASCTIQGHFTPTTTGLLTASVVISIPGFPQTIALTGTGTGAPLMQLSATSLNYGLQQVATQSGSQQVTLTNAGTAPATIAVFTITGTNASWFVFGSDCPSVLAIGASCTIHGHFAPKATGAVFAYLYIAEKGVVTPQSVKLTGTGTSEPTTISLSANSLSFGNEPVGAISASQSVILTNTGASSLNLHGITVTGTNASSFVFASTCSAVMAPGAQCTIHGHFAPTAQGPMTAAVTIVDSAGGSPQMITLTGTGQ